ncbi:MAG: Ig-like domain-containing protein [Clostridia bacterium]|nr:Ig-like domain-containing protein [Clostridia bacterium]
MKKRKHFSLFLVFLMLLTGATCAFAPSSGTSLGGNGAFELVSGSEYTIGDGLIFGIKPDTEYEEFASNFTSGVTVRDKTGNEITEGIICTGYVASCAGESVIASVTGDISGDGEIGTPDATLALKYDAGMIQLNDAEIKAADVNSDDESNSLDATLILKHDAGIINIFESGANEKAFDHSCRFNFNNSISNFVPTQSEIGYYMNDEDLIKLTEYIILFDDNPISTISKIQNVRYSPWAGSCFGMASSALLDFEDAIAFNENFSENAPSLYDVGSPASNAAVLSAINYYTLSQYIKAIKNASPSYSKPNDSNSSQNVIWQEGLTSLVNLAKSGKTFMLCYYYNFGGVRCGHAVVVYGYEQGTYGNHKLLAYDNRFPEQDLYLLVNSGYSTCTMKKHNGEESCSAIQFYPDTSAFDLIDIDGPHNDFTDIPVTSGRGGSGESVTDLYIRSDEEIKITNDRGEILNIVSNDIGGTMNIISTHFIVSGTGDGDSPVTLVLSVEDAESFKFETVSGKIDVAVQSGDMYARATSENAEDISVKKDKGIYITGENVKYSALLSSRNSDYNTAMLEGNAQNGMSLTYSGNDMLFSGKNTSKTRITFYSEITKRVSFDYDNDSDDPVILTPDLNMPHVAEPVTDMFIMPASAVLSIGEQINLTAEIIPFDAYDKTVTWSSSDKFVAKVDEDGIVTAISAGEAVITAKANGGQDVYATCKITVLPDHKILVDSVILNIKSTDIKVGDTIILSADILPKDATDKTIEWSSSDRSVATVDERGKVIAYSAGITTITARARNGTENAYATCEIYVK